MGNYLAENIADIVQEASKAIDPARETAERILDFLRSEYYLVDCDRDIEDIHDVMGYDELTHDIVDQFEESLKIINYIEDRGENK